jgi:hypothetical protein
LRCWRSCAGLEKACGLGVEKAACVAIMPLIIVERLCYFGVRVVLVLAALELVALE